MRVTCEANQLPFNGYKVVVRAMNCAHSMNFSRNAAVYLASIMQLDSVLLEFEWATYDVRKRSCFRKSSYHSFI